MANNINGNGDGPNGRNDSYTIPGRGVVDRDTLVSEVESGRHPNFHTIDVGGESYVRANPDANCDNNVDKC